MHTCSCSVINKVSPCATDMPQNMDTEQVQQVVFVVIAPVETIEVKVKYLIEYYSKHIAHRKKECRILVTKNEYPQCDALHMSFIYF
jgi:hypothetical protein